MTRDTIPCPPPMPDGWEVEVSGSTVTIWRSGFRAVAILRTGQRWSTVVFRAVQWWPDELEALVAIIHHYTTQPTAAVRIEEI